MRTIPILFIAATLCAGEAGGPPHGGPPGQDKRPPGPGPEELFQKADADKDGKVTLAELTAAVEARMQGERDALFARMDANGDGQVSKAEFLAFDPPGPPGAAGEEGKKRRRGPDPAEMMKRLDRNGDGVITADEVRRPDRGDKPHPEKDAKDDPLAP